MTSQPCLRTDSTTIAFLLPSIYLGEDSIEERIVNADIIVKARLNRITTEIVTTTAEKWSGTTRCPEIPPDSERLSERDRRK